MIIRKATPRQLRLGEPIRHADAHKRPVTRRDFIAQGFLAGQRNGSRTDDIQPVRESAAGDGRRCHPTCRRSRLRAGSTCSARGKIPFICIDLAGGANMVGSNVLIGGPGGQLDFLTTAGYGKMGLPGDMMPITDQPGDEHELHRHVARARVPFATAPSCAGSWIASRRRRPPASTAR